MPDPVAPEEARAAGLDWLHKSVAREESLWSDSEAKATTGMRTAGMLFGAALVALRLNGTHDAHVVWWALPGLGLVVIAMALGHCAAFVRPAPKVYDPQFGIDAITGESDGDGAVFNMSNAMEQFVSEMKGINAEKIRLVQWSQLALFVAVIIFGVGIAVGLLL